MSIKKFTSFFKYCSDTQKVIDGIFNDHKIRFTQPWGMNDPLEFNPTLIFKSINNPYQMYNLEGIQLPSLELYYRVQLIEAQINAYGILSLTKEPLSFDMWSKYANGHKGFLLEFKPGFLKHPCMKSKDGEIYKARKVKYVKNYSLNIEKVSDNNGDLVLKNLHSEIFYKKTSRWIEEKEYRVVRPFTDIPSYIPQSDRAHRDESMYLFDFSLECIKSVTFGACMSIENKRTIIGKCSDYEIEFYQAYILKNQYDKSKKLGEVRLFSIKELSSIEELYEKKPYLFILDKPRSKSSSVETIKRLKDLPYYEGNEEVVDSLYRALAAPEE